ncbi:MAG: DegT/DnrJ/EryC1/StrS family aminotransferase [Gemmatimonadales bacterium]|nr:DegT/DnrJ/EryC1/StrS family aminotransferase [Gemmatimonadales bacterium]
MTRQRVDMRSDTVTRPTDAMRRAMMTAAVGDDVFGDDPTVNHLQEVVAELLGKEAALFVPSGTMGNQLALKAQTSPGDQIIMEDGAHIYRYEAGGPAMLSGLLVTCLDAPCGWLEWTQVEGVLNPDNVHCAPPRLVCLENTHNRAGGVVFPQEKMVEIGEQSHALGLRVHLDGARLWHTHIAVGMPLAELAAPADTVSVCFSKGLGAPVGSILAGDQAVISRAHRFRKILGGGMRQAGILAAACLYALEHNLARLAEDHVHARMIVDGLDHSGLKVNHPVDTNIVIIDVEGVGRDQALLEHLECQGVLGVGFGPGRVRLIPNLDTSTDDVLLVLEAVNSFR